MTREELEKLYPEVEHKEHYLANEENKYFSYIKSVNCKGVLFDIYDDDYGICYHLAWYDPKDDKVHDWSCGMCNEYYWDMEDIADIVVEHVSSQN